MVVLELLRGAATARWAGVLAGIAVFIKLPFAAAGRRADRGVAVFAVVALWLRGQARERALLLTLGAAAAGTMATTITIIKPGTGLNVLVPSEPLLVTLALAGLIWALRSPLRTRAAVAAGVLGALMLAQSASLLLDPINPRPFHRPASSVAGDAAATSGAYGRCDS